MNKHSRSVDTNIRNMKNIGKYLAVFGIGALVMWAVSIGSQYDAVQNLFLSTDTISSVDTLELPPKVEVKYKYRDRVVLRTDSVIEHDTVYATKDSALQQIADSTRQYTIEGGDTNVRFTQDLQVAGKLLSQSYKLDYKLPTKVVTKTKWREIRRTDIVHHYTHNVYLSAATNESAGIHYSWKALYVGYEYGWQDKSHTVRAGVNVSHLFRKLFKKQ